MTSPLHLGVDVGSGRSKACVLDQTGRLVATAAAPHETIRTPAGGVEQEAATWLTAIAEAVSSCLARLDPSRVASLGVTGPAHAVVLTDGDGMPLRRVLMATDSRPQHVAAEMKQRYGDRLLHDMYVDLNAGWTLPQLAWLRSSEPDVWPHIKHVLPVKDFVVARLTGNYTTDPTDAAGTAFWEPKTSNWATDLCADIGLDEIQLPSIRASTSLAGGMIQEWADRFELTPGLPVAVGATDTACELVALGCEEVGDSIVKIASTGTVVCLNRAPAPGPSILVYPHVVDGLWFMLCAMNAAGTSLLWITNMLGASAPDEVARLMALAGGTGPGANGVSYAPFLEGERGVFDDASLRGAFSGLSSGHGPGDLVRAVLEGVALSLRTCRDGLRDRGLTVTAPWLTGGGFRSPLWRDIVTAVLGEPARVPRHEGSEIGAALIAAKSVGVSISRPVDETQTVPDAEWVQIYDLAYESYRRQARFVGKAGWWPAGAR